MLAISWMQNERKGVHFKSIGHHVFLWLGGFTCVLSLLFCGLVFLAAYVVEDEMLETLLREEVAHVQQEFSRTGRMPQTRYSFMQLHEQYNTLPTEVKYVLDHHPDAQEIFTPTDTHYHLSRVYVDDSNTRYLLADVSDLLVVTNMSRRIFFLVLVLTFCALLLALFIAYRIALFSVKPIKQLAREVEGNIERGKSSFSRYPFEVGFLAEALEEKFGELQKALTREKNFTRDVSHELRTPLTIIKNTLSLTDEGVAVSVENTALIRNASESIERTVDTLLRLARAESLGLRPCLINAVVEDVLLQQAEKIERLGVRVNLEVEPNVRVYATPVLLSVLLNNLIENAVVHCSQKNIYIEVTPQLFCIRNHRQPGFNDKEKFNVFDSGIKGEGSAGVGHGLFLVARVAEEMGWSVMAETDESSFEVKVVFSCGSS